MAFTSCVDVKIGVCILTALFGMGSWLATNGTWVELPILVDQLPEGWSLPSYMAVTIQLANIGPISITLFNIFSKKNVSEKVMIYIMVFVGSCASILMAFFWKHTSYVAGSERSTALLILLFFLSLVDCTSSVVFLPFMNNFKPKYITTFYVGSGLSGLIPSAVALIQGVGKVECVNATVVSETTNITEYEIQSVYILPRFPVRDFFIMIFSILVLCGIAFTVLNNLSYCKSEFTSEQDTRTGEAPLTSSTENKDSLKATCEDTNDINDHKYVSKTDEENTESKDSPNDKTLKKMSRFGFIYFLSITTWLNALTNGVLPSVQSYACLPYGSQAYHLSVTLANIANPVACFLAFFVPINSGVALGAITSLGSLFAAYIMVLAVYSPVPPFVDTLEGAAFVVTSFVIVYFLLSFTKVAIATLFRGEGRKALLWCGAVTQLGSAVGAAVMFVTVNVYNLFQQKYPCT